MMAFHPRLFCDTSFFYACLDPRDVNHERARERLEESSGGGATLWTTWDVISETATLLRYRKSFKAARGFLLEVRPLLKVATYGEEARRMAVTVFLRRGREHPLSFCDAISFVVVTTLLENMPCLAYDRDFRRLGLTVFE